MSTAEAAIEHDLSEETPFLGRDAEIHRLTNCFADASSGRGGLVLIEAESGAGKSRLVHEFQSSLTVPVFFGQSKVNSGELPFEQLKGVISGVVKHAARDAGFCVSLGQKLADWRDGLVTTFPELSLLFPGATSIKRVAVGEEASLRAVTAFFEALGSSLKGALLVLEDCQWADELTMRALAGWHTRTAHSAQHLLVLATYRTAEISPASALLAVKPLAHIRLGALGSPEVETLVVRIAGAVEPEVPLLVEKLCHGNPFLVHTVTRGFIETGILIPRGGKLGLRESRTDGFQMLDSAKRFLKRRLELLPPDCQDALKFAALLGREFDAAFIAGLAGWQAEDIESALETALRRGLVHPLEEAHHYQFAHDQLREATIEMLSAEERARRHEEIARDLVTHTPDECFAIAFHYDAAGKKAAALPYALKSAQDARERHFLEAAERQYRIAWSGSDEADKKVRRQIAAGLGEALAGRARYEEALKFLRIAWSLSDDLWEKTALNIQIGQVHTYRAAPQDAIKTYEEALTLLDVKPTESKMWRLVLVLYAASVQLLHTLFPALFLGRKPLANAERHLRIADLYTQSCYPLYFECRLLEGTLLHI